MTLQAQKPVPASTLRSRFIPVTKSDFPVDSLSIVPGSLYISGISDSAFTLDPVNAILHWIHPPPLDSVKVIYRVFRVRLNAITAHMRFDSVSNNFLGKPYQYVPPGGEKNDRFFNFGNLTYNG
ncbi:MAG: hypothetical protein ABI151_00125, partial [Chitinophagaceae bacterium]